MKIINNMQIMPFIASYVVLGTLSNDKSFYLGHTQMPHIATVLDALQDAILGII
ncbi:hypothetical protein J1N35_043746 [Gossypium stocksii]|uniref:Uncharacterized protein n=1 Tax=Gossypium stocksii TaxID=47602 RepID=A0A9D3U7Z7_9ROSI|nr:hypothetical protein J1N35_043746 [Gossypium stocksii]